MNTEPHHTNHKRRRTNSSNSPTPSSNTTNTTNTHKPLLFRLSEGWNKHRIFHQNRSRHRRSISPSGDGEDDGDANLSKDEHDTHTNNRNDNDSNKIPRRCCRDLKALRALIPKVEREYQLSPHHNWNLGEGGGAEKKMMIDSNEIGELCMFYGTIVMGTFCPHSHSLLFDDGRGVILRVIHVTLFPELSVVTHNSSSRNEHQSSKKNLERMKIRLRSSVSPMVFTHMSLS